MRSKLFSQAHFHRAVAAWRYVAGLTLIGMLVFVSACSGSTATPISAPTGTIAVPTLTQTPASTATVMASSTARPTLTSTPTPIPRATPSPTPAASPTYVDPRTQLTSGTYLVYTTRQGLFAAKMDGAAPIMIAPGVGDAGATLSPDGNQIAYSDNGQLKILNLSNWLFTTLSNSGNSSIQPAWSPDGQRLLFAFGDFPSIFVISTADGKAAQLSPWDTIEKSPAWSPDGQWIVFASDQAKIHSRAGSFLGATEL